MITLKIAWRNLWRNKRRSMIVLGSIVIGVAALILTDSFGRGVSSQMLKNQIDSEVAHIQVHKEGFDETSFVQEFVPEIEKVEQALSEQARIVGFSERTIVFGLVSSANSSTGILLNGVSPETEREITNISEKITDGKYLTGKRREIVISREIAEKLEVEIGDKIVAMANSEDGSVANDLYRVAGIYKTGNSQFDKINAFISFDAIQQMLGLDGKVTEFAIRVADAEIAPLVQEQLQEKLGGQYEVLSYRELLPLIMSYIETYEQSILIFYFIIGFAVLFGIINTMLMSVLERVQEFGVLMSLGMKNGKIFLMVVQEAFLLGVTGSVVGIILGILIFIPMNIYGIDFGAFAKSLNSFGIDTVVYPALNFKVILYSSLVMPVASIVGAIYPAWKAIRLQPTDAMRYV